MPLFYCKKNKTQNDDLLHCNVRKDSAARNCFNFNCKCNTHFFLGGVGSNGVEDAGLFLLTTDLGGTTASSGLVDSGPDRRVARNKFSQAVALCDRTVPRHSKPFLFNVDVNDDVDIVANQTKANEKCCSRKTTLHEQEPPTATDVHLWPSDFQLEAFQAAARWALSHKVVCTLLAWQILLLIFHDPCQTCRSEQHNCFRMDRASPSSLFQIAISAVT